MTPSLPLLGLVVAFAAANVGHAQPTPNPPLTVVELFTSQGCSSCPPANANVAALADRSDVIALSFGVTYWDQLGWKDTFARPEFTARQVAYARSFRDGTFTPEVVVDGRLDGVGARRGEIESLIARTHIEGPQLKIAGGSVQIANGPAPASPADVWMVRYDPRTIEVPVRAGENTGRTLPHRNVVKSLVRLGEWRGEPAHFNLPASQPNLETVILVQVKGAGPILAAARG